MVTVSVSSYSMLANIDLRCDGVSSRLNGAKLKRSAPLKLWKFPLPGFAGFQPVGAAPLFSVTSYQRSPSPQKPTVAAGRDGSQNVKRPCGRPELPAARPAFGSGN